ncbi:MAG: response regulator [Hahellaceae bacterium]|nr:response regulator [Hahellaceae bacterium]MCP5211774.1 response regulator [Hahellaceae bacterium]
MKTVDTSNFMALKFRERIAYKHAKLVVVTAFLLGVVVSSVQIFIDYQNQNQRLRSTFMALKETSVNPAAEAVWNLDEELAKSIVEGLYTNVGLLHVSIEVENGNVLAEKTRPMVDQRYRWITTILFGERTIETVSLTLTENSLVRVLGYLRITYDPYEESVSFIKRSGVVLISGIVKNLLLALLLFFIFYKRLTRPVEKLTESLNRIHPKEENNELVAYDCLYQGEFKQMYEKLNLLIGELNENSRTREQVQKSLNDINVSLEKKVRTRTEELNLQKDAADKANKAKSLFLATMSHEIRTPLNTILGLSSLNVKSKSIEQLTNYLVSINNAGMTLNALFDEVADFSQIEANKLTLRSEVFSLKAVLSDVHQVFRQRFIDKGVELEVKSDPLLPVWVQGDFGRLKQIVLNLASNALKFTQTGKVSLGCELLQENSHNHTAVVLFSVEDTGIGISDEFLQQMFQPFSQRDMSSTRIFQGMGLGLALASKIAVLMNSKIEVQSQEGKGSRFFFKVPLSLAAAQQNTLDTDLQFSSFRDKLTNKKLLLVEDIEINRFIVEEMLNEVGLSVVTAVNGKEAVDRCQEEDFDVILMDVQMPVMDGCEATYIIRHQLGYSALPIIALTANSLPQDKERCIASGMNDFLAKPVQIDELLDKIMAWV